MNYTQLTQEQRYQIFTLMKMGHDQSQIAKCLELHKPTISRELGRNKSQRGYRSKTANKKALIRRKQKAKKLITAEIWDQVEEKLRLDWSPEQVSVCMKKDKEDTFSHESIYQNVYAIKRAGGDLHRHLCCQKKYRKRYGGKDQRGKIPNRVSIEERPENALKLQAGMYFAHIYFLVARY